MALSAARLLAAAVLASFVRSFVCSFARSLEGGGQTKDSDAKVTFRSSDEMIITAAAAASISASALPKRPSFSRERE